MTLSKTKNKNTDIVDAQKQQELLDYLAQLEQQYPQLVEAVRVMNISYQQYLLVLQSLYQQPSFSTSSTRLTL